MTSTTHQSSSPALPRGRLMFALDATASRSETWATATELQTEMFVETAPIGKLNVQLIYYRGTECKKSGWVSSGAELARLMRSISCVGGNTQIEKVLRHALRENERSPLGALVFIGDAMEEQLGDLANLALQLGNAGCPIYLYQEGRNSGVRAAFKLLALKSGGGYFEFDRAKPEARALLADRLNAVARLVVGGREALDSEARATLTDRRV